MSYLIQNQTPVNGSIAWSSVRIVYDGTEYAIANGNTAAKYVYWQLASPTVLSTSATYPTLATQDCLVFLNNGGIATSILDGTIVDGSLIVPGTVQAGALVASSITANQIAANAIVSDKIAANAITGEKILANSITADRIDSRGLSIKDATGKVIFGVGTNLDASLISGLQPAVQQTVIDTVNDVAAVYEVIVESTNGDVFRVGQSMVTFLKAHVFRNGVEVTDSIPVSKFAWRRVSYYSQAPPNDDATWNAAYAAGYRQITITADSVYSRATYHCDISV